MSEILSDEPRACVTGHPIAHSRSPMIHGYWLKTLGLKGHYGRVDTPPDVFPDFVRSMAAEGYVGCNVTLPNKETAFRLADKWIFITCGSVSTKRTTAIGCPSVKTP